MLTRFTKQLNILSRAHFQRAFFSTEQKIAKTAVIFPGQGTQKVGMCKEFLDEAWSEDFLTQCDHKLGFQISKLMTEGPQETLDLTEYAQPAIFIQSYLKYERAKQQGTLNENDIEYLFGHSLGEYNALVAAKCLDPLEVVSVLQTRGRLMQECCEGKNVGMAVFLTDYNKIVNTVNEIKSQHSNQVCCVAAINSPKQFVLSGEVEVIDNVRKELKKSRIASVRMNVSAAFHSAILLKMKEEFKERLSRLSFSAPEKKVIRNYDVKIYEKKDDILEGLTEQINHTVLFQKTIEHCLSQDVRRFIDVGDEGTLSIMLKQITKELEPVKL